jgi:hypothetical protein
LFTNVTWLPRATVILAGLTVLLAIVIVFVGTGVGVGVGVGEGDVLEPPPHAIINAAIAAAAKNPQAVLFCISRISS